MKIEFISAFEITRNIVFEVRYYTLSNNNTAYFSTSAAVLNRPKTDYTACGQCQDDVLSNNKIALDFYNKWDKNHLSDLTKALHDELLIDLEELKKTYNYIYEELDISKQPYSGNISFYDIVDLSKQILKIKKVKQ